MEVTIDQIQDTIWQLRKGSAEHAENQRDFLMYDGSPCAMEVRAHLKALEIVRNQMLSDTLCICPAEVSLIYYNAKAYLGHLCADTVPDYVMSDRTDKAKWVLEHPECVLYEYWVDFLKAQCQRIGLNLDVKIKECASIGVDVKVAYEQACGEVLLDFTVEELKCDFGIEITVEELKQCKMDFEVNVVPLNCGIDLNTYVKALNCGYDMKAIVHLLKCGVAVFLTAIGADACVPHTQNGQVTLLSITCPHQFSALSTESWIPDIGAYPAVPPYGIEDVSCFPNIPNPSLPLGAETMIINSTCGCVFIPEDPELDTIPLDTFTLGMLYDVGGLSYEQTVEGNVTTDIYGITVDCNGQPGLFVITAVYFSGQENLSLCAPPPAYPDARCTDVTWTVTDPCGNVATCVQRAWIDSAC